MYNIYPEVKLQKRIDGSFLLEKAYLFCNENKNVFIDLCSVIDVVQVDYNEANVLYVIKHELKEEEYEITISDEKIVLNASCERGFYYATKTLVQIIKTGNMINNTYIHDYPDLKIRGFMHDISRNKVPKLETIKYIIDIMSDLKMNHLELYVEGMSFEYSSFKKYLENESYITIEEYLEVEKYANEHYIDFVPNENGFGHMQDWLMLDEFKDLAEAPDGIHLWGSKRSASTLNVCDDRSIDFISKLYKDMLPLTKSNYFNMNFDEPFEFGTDKAKEYCEKNGMGNTFIEYFLKAYNIIKSYNKTPLIWGDVLLRHQEILDKLPNDVIFLDWGYEAEYPFYDNLKVLKEKNIKFMAAPGTTTWCSLTARKDDYLENIKNAILSVYRLNGEGVLLTDWGDIGHLQTLPLSFAPLAFCGLLSYRVKDGTFKKLKEYLNKHIFKDPLMLASDVFIDSGTYYKYEPHYTGNGTVTFYTLVWVLNSFKENDPIEYFRTKMKYNLLSKEKFNLLIEFFNQLIKEVNICEIDKLFKLELINSLEILKLIASVNVGYREDIDLSYRLERFDYVINNVDKVIDDLRFVWLARNKQSKLNKSIDELFKLKEFAKRSVTFYQQNNERVEKN